MYTDADRHRRRLGAAVEAREEIVTARRHARAPMTCLELAKEETSDDAHRHADCCSAAQARWRLRWRLRLRSAQKKYDEGATDTEIKIGNTNPYSGNASAYGMIGKTIDAYFKMVNEQGGINGRKITFITYDDGYAPPKTVEMVRKLVEEDKVLFVFQTLGTPPNTAIQKYLNEQEGAAAVRRHRRLQVGRPQGASLDHGLPARLRHRVASSTPSTSWPTSRTPRSAC